MAKTPDSVSLTESPVSNSDPFPGAACAQDSSMDFWYDLYSRNQDESQFEESRNLNFSLDKSEPGPSWRDFEWGHVLDKSTKMKRKNKNTDVSSSSAVNSASDLSEALSAVSAALSLSSSASSSSNGSSETDEDKKEGVPELLTKDKVATISNARGRSKDEFRIPKIGMEFSSEAEAYEFYEDYANKIGFSVRKGKVQRLSDGTIRKRYFFCSKQGFRSKKQCNKITKYKRKETRTGCDAKIQFTVENGKWVISQFSYAHNHHLRHVEAFCTNTSKDRLMIHEENALTRKKLWLSKEQSAFLEESFKEHTTLNPKRKLSLAKQLGLRPRQVEVWFQYRRVRTKLKQPEVDCEYLKICCETLTEENRRLQKELQELRALKTSHPFYMQLPAATLTMCPSCERVATATTSSSK